MTGQPDKAEMRELHQRKDEKGKFGVFFGFKIPLVYLIELVRHMPFTQRRQKSSMDPEAKWLHHTYNLGRSHPVDIKKQGPSLS